MRIKRFKAALLPILVIASLLMPMLTLTSVVEAQAEDIIIMRGKSGSYNVDVRGDPP